MSREEQPPVPLASVTEFAAQQAEFLKHLFGFRTDQELANLSVIKLQEEAGEVAEAFLALQSLQRQPKLGRPRKELRASLGREIGDVTIVMALLADSVGLAFDKILTERIDQMRARREKMLTEAKPSQNGQPQYKPELPSPNELDDKVQLRLFS